MGAGQRGDIAVVGHHNGNAQLRGRPVIDGFDQLPLFPGNLQKQGGDHGGVADEHTGGGDANGVHRGILDAAVWNAVRISWKWYSGSAVVLGCQTTSSE